MELEACYRVLGIRSDADLPEIKSAFRRLAREYHPDRNKAPGAEEKFNEITEAYDTILSSHGVPIARAAQPKDAEEADRRGKLKFTIFTDKEVVHSVSPRLYEQEIRKRFNERLPVGTSCKIGTTWFEIENEKSGKIPILGSSFGTKRILLEWYKTPEGDDKCKPTTWAAFWTFVRRYAALPSA